jgi:hypothetical protein
MCKENKLSDFKIDMLKQEIDLINTKINHFDTIRLRLKQIAIVLWTATVGFALKDKVDLLFFISIFLPFPFWFIDTTYRKYYEGWHHRLLAIKEFLSKGKYLVQGEEEVSLEAFINGTEGGSFPLFDYWAQITIPEKEHVRITKFARNFFYRTSTLVYLPLVIISLFLGMLSVLNIKIS